MASLHPQLHEYVLSDVLRLVFVAAEAHDEAFHPWKETGENHVERFPLVMSESHGEDMIGVGIHDGQLIVYPLHSRFVTMVLSFHPSGQLTTDDDTDKTYSQTGQ